MVPLVLPLLVMVVLLLFLLRLLLRPLWGRNIVVLSFTWTFGKSYGGGPVVGM